MSETCSVTSFFPIFFFSTSNRTESTISLNLLRLMLDSGVFNLQNVYPSDCMILGLHFVSSVQELCVLYGEPQRAQMALHGLHILAFFDDDLYSNRESG